MTTLAPTRIAVLSLALCCATSSVHAAKPEADEAERANVQQILRSETATGQTAVNRRAALQPALRPATKADQTWWQSGYVRVDGEWRSIEKSATSDVSAATLTEYHRQRHDAPKSADGQFALANWCRRMKLSEQERAHLMQALLAEPHREIAAVYERLGYRRIANEWVLPSEQEAIARLANDAEAEFKRWQPKVLRIARNLEGNKREQTLAAEELDRINDVAAIPALESLLCRSNENAAKAALAVFARISAFEASQALARQAVVSNWSSVRDAATKLLSLRELEDYVPGLLSAMHAPVRSNVRWFSDPAGRYRIRFAWAVEGADHVQVGSTTLEGVGTPNTRSNRQIDDRRNENIARGQIALTRYNNDLARRIQDAAVLTESKRDDRNDALAAINSRIGIVLAKVTGDDEPRSPDEWWNWWADYSGTLPQDQSQKQIVIVEENTDSIPEFVPPPRLPDWRRQSSCLVAGTPIWTDRGFVGVEKIAAGDCVLAKDIDSGELAYKPVLHTTVRQPVPVRKFVVDGQPVVASSGHNFWVSGSGWTKTRELIPQQPIHTVVGMARVESVEDEAEPAPVYNLVVADFHTYFVGPAMLLSHDVLPPRPTNVKVPGLAMK
ncbi:MAG: polymorphic toxin-type HINT domain-containing protein [Planctomycetota bacterium]